MSSRKYMKIRNMSNFNGVLDGVLYNWKREVKSDSESNESLIYIKWGQEVEQSLIDVKSQKLYKETLQYLYVLSHEINTIDINDNIMTKFKYFFEDSEKLIMLYEKNKVLFDGLDRIGLVKKVLRKRSLKSERERNEEWERMFEALNKNNPVKDIPECEPFYPAMMDSTLFSFYEIDKQKYMEEDGYYSTRFYNTTAYLETNYHREIYFVLKHINKQLKGKNPGFLTKYGGMHYYNDKPIFRMTLIAKIHEIINDDFIVDIHEHTFFKEINFLTVINKLKIKENKNYYFFYIINKLSEVISNPTDKQIWLLNIKKHLGINVRYYRGQYRKLMEDPHKDLRKKIDDVFEPYAS